MTRAKKSLELKFERTIHTPPSEVFNAWLDPKIPGTPFHEHDKLIINPNVDGFFYWLIRGTPHYGRFLEMDQPSRIQHTWVSPYTLGEESKVTVTFQKEGDHTLMILVHSDLPDEEKAQAHEKGWNFLLGNFVEIFTSEAQS
jgi:uncharacterized protein YndB with AHSA1/START domain